MSQDLWKMALKEIKRDLDKQTFDTWFRPVHVVEGSSDSLTLAVDSIFTKNFLEDHYRALITDVLFRLTRRNVSVVIQAPEGSALTDSVKREGRPKRAKKETAETNYFTQLNTKYTFDNFVVGPSNQFAHAASRAVAEAPAKSYNPFFIYGGVGLGKTHLMQAIGHLMLSKDPSAKVIYVSAEQFTNEFINAIKDRKIDAFQRKYRGADALLIDDIQFFANKEKSQEEFFHTFNDLFESKKQLVISSDKPPKEVLLAERLRSRFEMGLSADIQPPNFETRMAILRKKAEEAGASLPDDSLTYIASRIKASVRDLEGALMKVVAMASLTNRAVTLELTMDALKDLVSIRGDGRVTIDNIQKTVAKHFKLSVNELKSKKRSAHIAFPRQIAMYLSRTLTDSSFPTIGTEFGGRDHTTVLYSCDKINNLIVQDKNIKILVEELKNQF